MVLAELQAIADMTAKLIGLSMRPRVVIQAQESRYARAYIADNIISIPPNFVAQGEIAATYYVAHEVCHFAPNCANHRKQFRDLEQKALAFWGLKGKRKHGNNAYVANISRI